MKRTGTWIVVGAVALAGCQNMGLYDAGEEADAVVAPPSELVAAVYGPTVTTSAQPLIMDGRKWVPAGHPVALGDADVESVGSAGGRTVYARGWDSAPYDALFTRGEDGRWMSYQPVPGGAGGAAHTDAGEAAPGH